MLSFLQVPIFLPQMWVLRAFLPQLIKNDRGSVVSVCALAGYGGFPNMLPFVASKGTDIRLHLCKFERSWNNLLSKVVTRQVLTEKLFASGHSKYEFPSSKFAMRGLMEGLYLELRYSAI